MLHTLGIVATAEEQAQAQQAFQSNPVAQVTAGLQLWGFVAGQAMASKAPFVILGAAAPLIAAWFLLKK